MDVPITQFRRDIFDLASRALKGESISVTYKGERLHLVPEVATSTRFDRLTTLQVVEPAMPDLDDEASKNQQQAEFERMWEKKWADL